MQSLEFTTVPFDAARRTALRVALQNRFLARIFTRRDSRIAWMASAQIALLFALALHWPVALYFVGPVVFGVVHLAADVRYLALRRAPPRALLGGSMVFAAMITIAQVALALKLVSARSGEKLDVALGALWIGYALGLALWRRPRLLLIAAPIFLGVAYALFSRAHLVSVGLVHLHNIVAIFVWLALFRRRRRWALLPMALVTACTLALVSGVCLPWTLDHGGLSAFGMRVESLGAWLAPGVRADTAVTVATLFVFFQGIHYAAWTGWIPQDDLRTEGTLTFRMTFRALVKDFGPIALGCVAVAALALIGLAAWDTRSSVVWYLVLAKSHAWFELAFLTFFLMRSAEKMQTGDLRPQHSLGSPKLARLTAAQLP